MTIQDFMLQAEKYVAGYLDEQGYGRISVRQNEIIKANDSRMHGLILVPEGCNAGWTVYVDDLYERYGEGEAIETVLQEAACRCREGLGCEIPVMPDDLKLDLESIRHRLSVRLLGLHNNISYMEGRPYIDAGCGLGLIAVIGCGSRGRGEWFVSVTEEILRNEIGCSSEELLTAALENTVRTEPPLLVYLEDYICANYTGRSVPENYFEHEGADTEINRGAYMLTNAGTMFGAAVLFYPGIMEKIADILGCGYYVLPSSVHEVMIIPFSADPDVQKMQDTVREANMTVVEKNELLSDNVFRYDPADGELTVVRGEMQEDTYERPCCRKSIA